MTDIRLDCQGLACPQPVLRCREALSQQHPERLIVTVDNEPAKENVKRFLQSQRYEVRSVDPGKAGFEIVAEPARADPGSAPPEETEACAVMPQSEIEAAGTAQAEDRQLVFITANVIGHGNDELGTKLMQNFLATLPEMGPSLWRIILINGGVRLAIQGSSALEPLQRLKDAGVSILVCGTCLEYFQLLEAKAIGETTNMLDVVTSLQLASKVIKV
jgi:selenium metabolism protein YedF